MIPVITNSMLFAPRPTVITRPPYTTVISDPPWPERGGGKIRRGANRHYPLMSVREITELHAEALLPGGSLSVAPDAHLYLWVTNTYLPAGLSVMAAAGFRYVTNLAWAKMTPTPEGAWREGRAGLGQYFRGAHELCLFGVRGKGYAACQTVDPRTGRRPFISSLLPARLGRHSEKPQDFRHRVERRSRGPYLEMFARGAPAPGWDALGDEALPAPLKA